MQPYPEIELYRWGKGFRLWALEGRLDRARFAAASLFVLGAAAVLALRALGGQTAGWMDSGGLRLHLAGVALCLACLVPLAARRGRDLGWSGWTGAALALAALLAAPAVVVLVVALAAGPGETHTNRHGPVPPPLRGAAVLVPALALLPLAAFALARALAGGAPG